MYCIENIEEKERGFMKTDVFPDPYLKNILGRLGLSSKKRVTNLKLGFNIVSLFFLTSILMVPVSLNFLKMETYPMRKLFLIHLIRWMNSVCCSFSAGNKLKKKRAIGLLDQDYTWLRKNGM